MNNDYFPQEPKETIVRPDISGFAVWSYRFAVLSPMMLVVMAYLRGDQMFNGYHRTMAQVYVQLAVRVLAVLGILMGIVAFLTVRRSKCELRGRNYALAGIVVGILALYIGGMMIPSINSYSDPRHLLVCQAKLKDLGTAVLLYSSDFDNVLPSSAICQGRQSWNKTDFVHFNRVGDKSGWPYLLEGYLKNRLDNADISCPYDPDFRNQRGVYPSYYWKAAIDRAWYDGFHKVEDFPHGQNQMLMYERSCFHGDETLGLSDSAFVNCLYVDMHVERNRIINSGYKAGDSMLGPLPESGVGEPAWFNGEVRLNGNTSKPETVEGCYWDPRKWGDYLPN